MFICEFSIKILQGDQPMWKADASPRNFRAGNGLKTILKLTERSDLAAIRSASITDSRKVATMQSGFGGVYGRRALRVGATE
jgi:hypothetical protein